MKLFLFFKAAKFLAKTVETAQHDFYMLIITFYIKPRVMNPLLPSVTASAGL
jgi:hypothetical protein